MEAVAKEVVTVVFLELHHPTIRNEILHMTFVFDRQPQIDDVLQAYAEDNFMNKHSYFNDYGSVLTQCLKTYGVPQLCELHTQNAEGQQIQPQMLTARWNANLMGRTESIHNYEFGFIRVYIKPINIAKRVENPPRPEVLKTEVKRARKPAATKTQAKK